MQNESPLVVLVHMSNGVGWEPAFLIDVNDREIHVKKWGGSPLYGININNNDYLEGQSARVAVSLRKVLEKLKNEGLLQNSRKVLLIVHEKELEVKPETRSQERLCPGTDPEWKAYSQDIVKDLVENHELWWFMHVDSSLIGREVLASCDAKVNLYDKLINACVISGAADNVAVLKHAIGHLFLPLDIDLQAIASLYNPKSPLKAAEYFTVAFPADRAPENNSEKKLVSALGALSEGGTNGVIFPKVTGFDLSLFVAGFNRCRKSSGQADLDSFVNSYTKGDGRDRQNLFHEWFEALMKSIDKA